MGSWTSDLRIAARALGRSPGFALATVVTLTLALAANVAIFSLVNTILLAPLPGVADPERILNVYATAPGVQQGSFSAPDFVDLRDRSEKVAVVAAFQGRGLSLGVDGATELVAGQLVSGRYFSVMGTRAALGRLLDDDDNRAPGASPVAVISQALWMRRFGGDATVVGRVIRVNGFPFTVVGVAEPGFRGHFIGFAHDLWVPLAMAAQASPDETLSERNSQWLELVARPVAGHDRRDVEGALASAAASLAREYPDMNRDRGLRTEAMTGIDSELRGPVVGMLALLQSGAGIVLLVACINVAGLLLARATAREKDTALRLALGARRGDLLRPHLAETLLLFGLAGACAPLVGLGLANALVGLQPRFRLPLSLEPSFDMRVVAFTALATLLAALGTALVPALQATRLSPGHALKEGSPEGRVPRTRLRRAFIVGEVALSVVLLVTAGLFVRALARARSLDPGFRPDNVRIVRLNLTLLGRTGEQARVFASSLLERVTTLPGVERVSLAQRAPLGLGGLGTVVSVAGHPGLPPGGLNVDFNAVTPGYFATLGIPLLSGRDFGTQDSGAHRVAVLNQALARRLWPTGEVVGRRLQRGSVELEVVGVVADTAIRRVGETPRPQIFTPFFQDPAASMAVLVRTPGAVAPPGLREAVHDLEPHLPVLEEMPLREWAGFALAPQRLAGTVATTLGALGLTLSGVGLYGVVAFMVGRRRREIGVRVALGARERDVMSLVLGEGLRLTLLGAAIGLLAAAAVAPLLRAFLPLVGALDPPAYVGAAVFTIVVGLAACWEPARRATRVPVSEALRAE
jgi:predicted permease